MFWHRGFFCLFQFGEWYKEKSKFATWGLCPLHPIAKVYIYVHIISIRQNTFMQYPKRHTWRG